jgi:hypothetical protein
MPIIPASWDSRIESSKPFRTLRTCLKNKQNIQQQENLIWIANILSRKIRSNYTFSDSMSSCWSTWSPNPMCHITYNLFSLDHSKLIVYIMLLQPKYVSRYSHMIIVQLANSEKLILTQYSLYSSFVNCINVFY